MIERRDLEREGVDTDDASGHLHAVYLYFYIYDQASNSLSKARTYEYFDVTQPISDIDRVTLKLIKNAIIDGDQPPLFSPDPSYMIMRRQAYLVFAVDGAVFDTSNPVEFKGMDKPKEYTFTRQEVGFIEVGRSKVTFSRFRNTLKHSKGHKLEPRKFEDFSFDFNFTNIAPVGRDDDSGGTNMGGPVPPPGRKVKKDISDRETLDHKPELTD